VTDRVLAEYRRGSSTRLDNLWRELGNSLLSMCDPEAPASGQGPAALSRLFRIGGTGGGGGPRFRVDRVEAHLVDGVWAVRGRVVRLGESDSAWSFTTSLWMDGETGRGVALPLQRVSAGDFPVELSDGVAECTVPASVTEAWFEGRSAFRESVDAHFELLRTRLRVEVVPRMGAAE
jgi:hypothetical protein